MTLRQYPVAGKMKSRLLCASFVQGAPRSAVGQVFAGVKQGNAAAWRNRRAPWFHVDNSYTDAGRGDLFRVTCNRLQHDGRGTSDGARLAALGIDRVEPMRQGGDYALVVEQSPDFMRWQARPWAAWPDVPCTPIVRREWRANKPELVRTLADDLAGARLVVTHSSAAAVQALIAGVPVFVSPDSCAYRFSGRRDISADERLQWLAVLADRQFTRAEIQHGLAWETVERDRKEGWNP